MFEWSLLDEAFLNNVIVRTHGTNLHGGVLLRTSRVVTLKHGESVVLAETFVPGVGIKDGILAPLVAPTASTIEHLQDQPFHRFRGSIQLMNGDLEHRGVSVLNMDWSARDVLSQLVVDGWPVDKFRGVVKGWPSNRFEIHRSGGEPIFIFEYVGCES